jgi:hypothetical protein
MPKAGAMLSLNSSSIPWARMKSRETFAVFANVSLDALFPVGKLCAFGLTHIGHVYK